MTAAPCGSLRIADHPEPLERPVDAAGAIHVRLKLAEFFRLGFRGVAHGAGFQNRLAILAGRFRDVIEGAATLGEFPQGSSREHPLFRPRLFDRLQRVRDIGAFRWCEILAEGVFRIFAKRYLFEINDGDRDDVASELLERQKAPLPRDQRPIGLDDYRIEQPDFFDASGEGGDVEAKSRREREPILMASTGSQLRYSEG